MKRKILYPIIFVVVLVLGYLNYFREEPGIKQVDAKVETTNVAYETSGYFIEAKKQFDDLKTKDTSFEDATAKFKDMILSGDNVLLNAAKNLFLKNHVVGKSGKEWEFFTEELSYNNLKDAITSHSGIKVVNKIQNIIIESENLKTNSKFEFVELEKNVKVKNNDTEIFANKARYTSDNKVITLDDNGSFKTKNNEGKEITGTFKKGKYDSNKKMLELFKNFTINYAGVTLNGNKMWYNDKGKNFAIIDNPVILLGGYEILSKEIKNPDGKEIIYIKGKITGTNGETSFVGDKAHYNTENKNLYIEGNVVITSKSGEKIVADKVVYNTITKNADFIGKDNKVVYSFKDRTATATKVVYNTDEKVLHLDEGYRYKDQLYTSRGEKLDYSSSTNKGTIFNGNLFVKEKGEEVKGEKITFNTKTRDYTIEGHGEVNNGTHLFKSEKLSYLNSEGFAHLEKPFTILNLKDKSTLSGESGEYNITTQEFVGFGKILYKNKEDGVEISGNDFKYNLKTEQGEISKNVNYKNIKEKMALTGDTALFAKDKYINVEKNLKIETESSEIFGDKGIYNIENKVVEIPEKVRFNSKDKTSKGIIYDGIFEMEKNILKGKNLDLTTDRNGETTRVTGKNAEYNTENKELKLKKSVKIENSSMTLTNEDVVYNTGRRVAKLNDRFKLVYDKEFTINGTTGIVNMDKGTITAEKIKVTSTKKEEMSSDRISGDMNEMRFDFIGNVKGKLLSKDSESQEIVPILYKGNFIRNYFKKDNNSYQVIRTEGRKGSVITRGQEKFYSDYIELDLLKNTVYAGKNNKVIINDETGTTEIVGNIFSLNRETNIANITGDVSINNINKEKKKVTLKGEESTINTKKNTIEVEKNVKVENEELILDADKILYNKNTNKLKAFGEVKVNYKVKGAK